MKDNSSFVSEEVLDQIRKHTWLMLQAAPFKKETLERLHHVSFHYGDGETYKNLNLNEAVIVAKEIHNALIVSKNLNMAVNALVEIQLGKYILMIKDHIKYYNKHVSTATERKLKFTEVGNELFGFAGSSAKRYEIMRVAKIPYVESYAFLGMTRLYNIAPAIEALLSFKQLDEIDPVQSLLIESGYTYKLDTEEEQEKFKFLIDIAANKLMLNIKKVPIDEANLLAVTKSKGVLTSSNIKLISSNYQRTGSIDAACTSTIKSVTKKSTTEDISPSYNKLEETILDLSDMIEDILDDGYCPDYSAEITASMFATLASLQEELIYAWSESSHMKWKGFKEVLDR